MKSMGNEVSSNREAANTPGTGTTTPGEYPPLDLGATQNDAGFDDVDINPKSHYSTNKDKGFLPQASSNTLDTGDDDGFDTPDEIFARIQRKGPPSEGPLGLFRYKCGVLVNYPLTSHIITAIIIINSILMVVSTFDFVLDDESITNSLDIVDTIFLCIFTLESALQVSYYSTKIFSKGWLTFDLILVISSWALPEMTVFRALRILRIAARLKAIENVLTALFSVIPNVGAIFALLMLVFYIFAVMFTTIFKGYHECCPEDAVENDPCYESVDPDTCVETAYFPRLDLTLFSLFQFLTMDFQGAARMYAKHVSWAPILFVLFVVLTGFIVFNLIVAVLCDALGVMNDEEEKKKDEREVEHLLELSGQVRKLQENQELILSSILGILRKYDGDVDTALTGSSFSLTPPPMTGERSITFLDPSESNGKTISGTF